MSRRWAALYLAVGLVLVTMLSFTTAPFFVPDEPAQSMRAIALAHGHLLPSMPGEEPGADIDTGVIRAADAVDRVRTTWEKRNRDFLDRGYGPMSAGEQNEAASIRWSAESRFVGFGNTGGYPPLLYVPAMVAWRAGESLHWTVFASLRLARLLTGVCAVLLAWLALRLCAAGGWMLLPLLLLPSAVFLFAGSSQDALLLPAAAVLVALVSRALQQRRAMRGGELALAALALAGCAMARPPYVALGLLLLLPLAEAAARGMRAWAGPVVALLFVLAASLGWRAAVARFGLESSDEADPVRQAAFVQAHPGQAMAALGRGTAEAAWDFVHRGLYVVGWNDLLPHHGVAMVIALCLGVYACCAPGVRVRTWAGRCLLLAATVLPLLGISLAEYLIWTPPGRGTVYGIQPRYWLPVLPAAMLMITSLRGPLRAGLKLCETLLACATAVLALAACSLPWFEATAFYRLPLHVVLLLNLR